MITIKSDDEIKIMREAGRIVGEVLRDARRSDEARRRGQRPRQDRAQGVRASAASSRRSSATPAAYPATVCISINDELVHGIPGDRVIKEGDIVSIDLGATYKGFVGDSAVTIGVGEITPRAAEADRRDAGVALARHPCREGRRAPRRHLGAIGDYIESQGYGVVREYVGHGVGRADARRAAGAELRPGRPRSRPAQGHGPGAGADGHGRRLARRRSTTTAGQ